MIKINDYPSEVDAKTLDRLFDKVNVGLPSECWEWNAAKSRGYGMFTFDGKKYSAHRFMYSLINGGVDKNMVLDHLCRNTACVNPFHLEEVSNRENVLRGEINGNANKTECKHGHPFDETNTYITSEGKRHCRTCHRERELKRYHRMKVTA